VTTNQTFTDVFTPFQYLTTPVVSGAILTNTVASSVYSSVIFYTPSNNTVNLFLQGDTVYEYCQYTAIPAPPSSSSSSVMTIAYAILSVVATMLIL